ncbi:hypothetical protein ACQP00_31270 [Dactylosporangium sp. CS-047395]|uniref:hypothetical protein n=1 Tax=Dactylosporangium sp. CS-047395 TaxID=3239936 RepID=UPI003D8D595D
MDARTGKEVVKLDGHVLGLAFSPDGRTLAAGGTDKSRIYIWNRTKAPGSSPLW